MGKKILGSKKEYTYLLIRIICCLIKNLDRKTQWKKPRSRKKSAMRIILSWLKYHLISCDDVYNLRTLWLIYSFSKKNHTFPEYGVSFITTRRTFDFLHGGLLFLHSNIYFIDRQDIIVLHMQTHRVLERELYADQINILHLRNQSILYWIPRNRINP